MKKNFWACVFFLLVCVIPVESFAKYINAINPHPFEIYVAYAYKDTKNVWRVRGWFRVTADSQRKIHFDTNSRDVYVYAENKGKRRYWPGHNHHWDDREFFVVEHKINHRVGVIPKGKNLRRVRFDKITFKKGRDSFAYKFK